MQNKGTVKFFTLLLILAAVYALSFNFITGNFENKVLADAQIEVNAENVENGSTLTEKEVDELAKQVQQDNLRNYGDSAIYPVFNTKYAELKEKELNLGLDLRGGISATLELPINGLLEYYSDDNPYPPLVNSIEEARAGLSESSDDYMTLFTTAWNKNIANETNPLSLKEIFNNFEFQNKFDGDTDEEILESVKKETEEAIKNTQNIIRKRIDQFGVAQPNITRDNSGRIIVELPGVANKERVIKILRETAKLEFWDTYFVNSVIADIRRADEALGRRLNPEAYETKKEEKTETIESAESTVETTVENAVKDTTDTELFNLDNDSEEDGIETATKEEEEAAAAERKLKSPVIGRLLGAASQASLGIFRADETDEIDTYLNSEEYKTMLPSNLRFLWGANETLRKLNNGESVSVVELYLIKTNDEGKSKLDGSCITQASSGFDPFGKPEVTMQMDGPGTVIWEEMTTDSYNDSGRAIAIALDDKIQSAPGVTNGPITGGSSSISMGAQSNAEAKADADDLAGLLSAGSLPTKPIIVDLYTVGPTLGQANIDSGLLSFMIALLLILVYLVFYYRGAGLVAGLTLIINLILLLGGLATLGAALTLPGIAGIVLTIGMAVDANVLIFERVREEQRHGKSLMQAVKDGYSAAYSAIIDANVTTLLTGVILFVFGSGPIQGFATTLIIGIFTSLFSAVILSKLIIFSRVEKKKSMSFSSELTKNWLANTNFQFIKNRKKYYMISAIVVLLGVVSLFTAGLKFGIDFAGGSKYEVKFDEAVDHEVLINIMKDAFVEDGTKASTQVTSIGTGNTNYKITSSYMINSTVSDVDKLIADAFTNGLDKVGVNYSIPATSKVTGSISDDFRRGAMWATIFSLLVIFLYIIFRFKKWTYGAGALIALTHDVLIVLGLFALLKGIVPFTLEVNQAFIAAILTVVGYSINDTVVVFDRIREYLGLRRNQDQNEVINSALNSTLSRTVNTSLTTFMVLLMIFIFGGDDIKGFTFALMLGVVVGTYSSIFIATPAVVDLSKSARDEEE